MVTMRVASAVAVLLVVAALAACGGSVPASVAPAGPDTLRAHFERDAGMTRLVLILSPT